MFSRPAPAVVGEATPRRPATACAPASLGAGWTPSAHRYYKEPPRLARIRHGGHTLLFENDAVRVLDTCITPRERTPVHTHRWPSVLYILSWSAFVRRDASGVVALDSRTVPQLASPPPVLCTAPLAAHSLENVGAADLRVVSVELKRYRLADEARGQA